LWGLISDGLLDLSGDGSSVGAGNDGESRIRQRDPPAQVVV
jgi:hypothetical protein